MKCPECKMTIKRLGNGGVCPNPNCRVKLHKLGDEYITLEQKEKRDRVIEFFRKQVSSRRSGNFSWYGQEYGKQFIYLDKLIEVIKIYLADMNSKLVIERIDPYDFCMEYIKQVFDGLEESFAMRITSIAHLHGSLFARFNYDVYLVFRQRIISQIKDEKTIERNKENPIELSKGLF